MDHITYYHFTMLYQGSQPVRSGSVQAAVPQEKRIREPMPPFCPKMSRLPEAPMWVGIGGAAWRENRDIQIGWEEGRLPYAPLQTEEAVEAFSYTVI